MQIKVVRRHDGELLFVEANSDFVNLLAHIQHLPIGALAQLAENDNAFATLQDSCRTLPKHLFVSSKKKALISSRSVNAKELVEGKPKPPMPMPTFKTHNMSCKGSGTGPYTCTANRSSAYYENAVAFRDIGNSFEMTITLSSSNPVMVGILPDDSTLQSKLATRAVYNRNGCFLNSGAHILPRGEDLSHLFNGCSQSNGDQLKMRFEHQQTRLSFSYNGNDWCQVSNPTGYSITAGTMCCPVLLTACNVSVTVNEIKSLSASTSGGLDQVATEFFKTESTFLVTNELKVLDSGSFSSHLQLLPTYQVSNVLTLKTSTVAFGTLELQKLLAAIFNGDRKVLAAALDGDQKQTSTATTTAAAAGSLDPQGVNPLPKVVQVEQQDDASNINTTDSTTASDHSENDDGCKRRKLEPNFCVP